MKETMKKLKKCLDCNADISQLHFNRKRCETHALNEAKAGTSRSIKKWKHNNSNKVTLLNKKWSEKFPLRKRFSHAKGIAKSRNYECLISRERFIELWNQPCNYCDKSILLETGIGLDRLDNKLGYVESNIVPCCGDCNYIRGDKLTPDEMKVAMAAVINFRKKMLGEI